MRAAMSMNRLLTQLILAFAGWSLVATLLPLAVGPDGGALIEAIDRRQSLLVYVGFLLVFFLWIAPVAYVRAPTRHGAWSGLVCVLLLFALVPLLFTAYISGVSAAGLVRVVLLLAGVAGVPLLLLRTFASGRVVLMCHVLGAVTLFILPGLSLYRMSVGLSNPQPWSAWSPWFHLKGIITDLAVPDVRPFLAFAVLIWGPILFLTVKRQLKPRGTRSSAAVILFLGVCWSGWNVAPVQGPFEAVSLVGQRARAGFRTPLRIMGLPADGDAVLRSSLDAVSLRGQGGTGLVLLAVGPGDRTLSLEVRGQTHALANPCEIVPEDRVLVGFYGSASAWQTHGARVREWAPEAVWVDSEALSIADQPAAWEGFDWVVISEEEARGWSGSTQEALDRYVAFGGRLVRLAEQERAPVMRGQGTVRAFVAAAPFPGQPDLPKVRRGSLLERNVVQTFAHPDWQEMDLRKLLWFAVVYHFAFLLAFLLPLFLDSKKSMGIYLVSVAFVTVVVVGLATRYLKDILLKDNQVYTQSIAVAIADGAPDGRLLMRQFLSFASMSGETRDLVLPGCRDAVVYGVSDADEPPIRSLSGEDLRVEQVTLNRTDKKRVVRVDRDVPSPFRYREVSGDLEIRLDDQPFDPLGLRSGAIKDIVLVDQGRRFSTRPTGEVGRWSLESEEAPGLPSEQDFMLRRLLGHFAPRQARFLLVQMEGVVRPDDPRNYFGFRDLGTYVVLPLP